MLEVSDPRSAYIKTVYRYNARNQAIEQRLPDAAGNQSADSPDVHFYYDQLGRNVAVQDANGNLNGQVFDAGGNLIEERHADGGVVRHGYNAFSERIRLQDALGNVTRYQYDQAGQLLHIIRPDSTTISYRYDSAGRKLGMTDGAGGATAYRYDAAGNLTTVTQPLGQQLWSLYDARGNKSAEVDANGFSSTWSHDAFGRITAHTDLSGAITHTTYDGITGQLTAQSNTRGQNLAYAYDDAGQLTQIVDQGVHRTTTYGYDLAGNRTYEGTVQDGVTTQSQTLSYDAQNRLTDVHTFDGVQLHIDYDKNGNRVHETIAYEDQGVLKGQSLWYAYDAMNRQILVDGAVDGNAANLANLTTAQGHILRYDANGNRIQDLHIGTQIAVHELHGVDESGNAVTLHQYASQQGLVRETYRYDSNNRLTRAGLSAFDSAFQMQDESADIVLDARQYDGADRVIRSGAQGITQGYADQLLAAHVPLGTTATVNSYDINGRSQQQDSYGVDASGIGAPSTEGLDESGNTIYSSQAIANDATLMGAANFALKSQTRYDSYDGAGNLKTYHVTVPGDGGYTSTYTYAQARFDGYKEASIDAVRSDNEGQPGQTVDSYDVNGDLTGLADANKGEYNRSFVNDANGAILQKKQQEQVLKQLVVHGQVLGTYGSGTDPSKNINDDGSPNYIDQADFNLGYRAIDSTHPAPTQGMYTVREGDTLQGIAQQVYGDAQLWYVIADANGTTKPRVGESLVIPNRVGGIHNDSKTFKPYEASRVVGDTTPNLPAPAGDDGGCGGFGQIVQIVIAVAITVVTGGIGGAILGSVVSQLAGMAMGIQKDFSWEAVALSAVSAGVSAGVGEVLGPALQGVNPIAQAVVKAAVSNALTQGIGVATGLQRSFSWVGVAAAAVGAGVGETINESLLGQVGANGARTLNTDFAKALGGGMAAKVIGGTIAGFASGAATALMRGGKISVTQIATDAFGNALGSSIADSIGRGSQQTEVLGATFAEDMAARKAANPILGWQSQNMDRPLQVADSGQFMTDAGSPYGDVNFGEPVKPNATSDAVFNVLVDGMQNPRPAVGPRIVLDDFGNPMSIGQGQDADIQYRGRRATLDDMAIYQATGEEMAGLKFNKIFRPDDPNHYVIGSFLDGTWNKRGDGGLNDLRPGIDSTNVGLLQWMSEGQSDNFRTKYFEGVGTDWYTKHFGGATGAGMTLRVEDAYKWTADQVNAIYAGNQNATFDFLGVGFSRGSVETRMLLRALDARGIPDYATRYEVEVGEGRTEVRYERHIIAPGQANLNAVVFDSVSTGAGDFYNLDVPGRAQVYHPVARDEMRSLFPSAPLTKSGEALSPSWYQPVLPGDHSDLGNNHDRGGLGDWNLQLAHQFMTQQLGLPLQTIPGAYTPNPSNMWIHDMSGRQGVAPPSNSPFVRPLAPRYAPPQPQPAYGGG